MSTDITGISGLNGNGQVLTNPKPGTAPYLVRITGTGADQYVSSARIQTVTGLGLLGGGLYAALKHTNTYWGYAIGALSVGGLLVANALFNTLGGLKSATRDFARKNFNTQYFDAAQVGDASSLHADQYAAATGIESLNKVKNLVSGIKRNISLAPYS